MADFATLKQKYAMLRSLREARASKKQDNNTQPARKKPAAPPRNRAPPPPARITKKQLSETLAQAGIGEHAEEEETATNNLKRPGARKRQQQEELESTPPESMRNLIDGAVAVDSAAPPASAPAAEEEVELPSSGTIFINQLPRFCGHAEICRSFGRFGDMEAVYLVHGRGCGFVRYSDAGAAQRAIQQMNSSLFCGNRIFVEAGPAGKLPEDAKIAWFKEETDYKPAEAKKTSAAGRRPPPPPPPRDRKKQQRMVAYEFD